MCCFTLYRSCKSKLANSCCCFNRNGHLACPGQLIFKKKCLFLIIVFSIIFSALFAASSTFYLSVVETEWVYAKCHVSKVSWKPDLYDIYLSNFTDPIFTINKTMTNKTNDVANLNATDPIALPTKLQVKGWLYLVDVKYKNMYFHGAIRDPSETEMIPAIYEENGIYDCLCMIEKLRSEITFQKETYEKYLAYMKKHQEEDEGKSGSEYIYDDNGGDVDENIFFVVATMWPKIDVFSENHEIEKTIKIILVSISLIMLLIGIIMLKVFYSYYINDGEPDYTHVSRI